MRTCKLAALTGIALTLIVAIAMPVAADNLGRIFLTQSDRDRLEVERYRTRLTASSSETPGQASSTTDVQDTEYESIGLIMRSDGRKYLWKGDAFVETDDDDPAASVRNPIAVASELEPDQSDSETPERTQQ